MLDFLKNLIRTKSRNIENISISGRSMVEMLGVLAIIGVLSIGAISGYQKAMFKYRLNKQSEQLTTLLSNLNMYRQEWTFSTQTNLVPYYVKLKVIPENMIRNNQTVYLYDVFDNQITLSTSGLITNPDGSTYVTSAGLDYYLQSNSSFDLCLNLFENVKAFREDIFRTTIQKTTEEDSSSSYANSFYGDNYCTKSRKCIKDASLEEIHSFCQFCQDSKTCRLWASFPIKDSYIK